MGLKMWINWITWVFFTMMLFVPTSVIITYFLTEGSSPAVAADPVLIWLVLNLFMITFITLIFAMSTLFTNGEILTVVDVFGDLQAEDSLSQTNVRAPRLLRCPSLLLTAQPEQYILTRICYIKYIHSVKSMSLCFCKENPLALIFSQIQDKISRAFYLLNGV